MTAKPKPRSEQNKALFVIVPVLLFAIFGIALNLSSGSKSHEAAGVNTQLSSQEPLTAAATSTAAPVFDVPALVGLDINQVRSKLGRPSQFSDPATTPHPADESEWDETWEIGKEELLVTYDLGTNRVKDFFVSTDDPSGASSDLARIRSLTNTCGAPSNYQLIPVAALGHFGQYTGLNIVPR